MSDDSIIDAETQAIYDALLVRVREIVDTCPPDLDRYAHAVSGYLLDEPAEGSVEMRCDNCDDPAIVDPHGQLILSTVDGAKVLCPACAAAVYHMRQGRIRWQHTRNFDPTKGRTS